MYHWKKRLLDRLTAGLVRRGFGPCSVDPLDAYARSGPDLQATLDIFQGSWSSAFPGELGLRAGVSQLFDDARIAWLLERLGSIEGWRVLELGPLEGGHSYMMERAGAASVQAIEACVLSFLKCLIVKEALGLQRVAFQFGDFMPFLAGAQDRFDLVLASGVLYHQREPVRCLEYLASRTDRLFLWTTYYVEGMDHERVKAQCFREGPRVRLGDLEVTLHRLDYDTYLPGGKYRGGVDSFTHWMKRDDILACLDVLGFDHIETAFELHDHPFGPNLAILARRSHSCP